MLEKIFKSNRKMHPKLRWGSAELAKDTFSVSQLIVVKMEDYIYCRYTGGLSWQKSCSRILLNGIDARIDTMLVKADNLTKLKRAASTLEDRLRNQNCLDRLKLQFEKIWCYSIGTSAWDISESERNREIEGGASGVGAVQLKDQE